MSKSFLQYFFYFMPSKCFFIYYTPLLKKVNGLSILSDSLSLAIDFFSVARFSISTKKHLEVFMSNNKEILFKELSYQVIGIAFKIHTKLGSALPEHCYHHAFEHELALMGIPFTTQQVHQVYYDNNNVGHFFSDLVIDNKIILELKSDASITSNHVAQLFTYLRVTRLKVGYIINFGYKSLQFKRLIL
jgi:GxxExxY protein